MNNFGLGLLGGAYNGVSGNLAVTGVHSILIGVSNLYYNNGNTVTLFGADPNAQIIEISGQVGLLGVYDNTDRVSPIPEPSTWTLVVIGVAIMLVTHQKRKRQGA